MYRDFITRDTRAGTTTVAVTGWHESLPYDTHFHITTTVENTLDIVIQLNLEQIEELQAHIAEAIKHHKAEA